MYTFSCMKISTIFHFDHILCMRMYLCVVADVNISRLNYSHEQFT